MSISALEGTCHVISTSSSSYTLPNRRCGWWRRMSESHSRGFRHRCSAAYTLTSAESTRCTNFACSTYARSVLHAWISCVIVARISVRYCRSAGPANITALLNTLMCQCKAVSSARGTLVLVVRIDEAPCCSSCSIRLHDMGTTCASTFSLLARAKQPTNEPMTLTPFAAVVVRT